MNMKNFFLKKEKGSSAVIKMIPIILTVVISGIIAIYSITQIKVLNAKNDIDLVMRQFLLKMETTGYLTNEYQNDMKNKLSEIGMEDIDLTGTTLIESSYGQKITLYVSGTLSITTLNVNGINVEYFTKSIPIVIIKESTAKQ